jgi:hypothetical protein
MSKPLAQSDFGGSLGSDHAFMQAESNGNVVVLPRPHELFIDIDNDANEHTFHVNLTKIADYVGISGWDWAPSKSGEPERKHITVQLNRDVTPLERILLQAVLGSDLRRELLSYCRWTMDDPNPTLFFEKGPALLTAPPEQKQLVAGVLDDQSGYFDTLG